MWILTVCIGILWGNGCEKVLEGVFPTEQACIHRMEYINKKLRDGYATCKLKDK